MPALLVKTFLYVSFIGSASFLLYRSMLTKESKIALGIKPLWLFLYLNFVTFLSPNFLILNLLFVMAIPIFCRKRTELGPLFIISYMFVPTLSFAAKLGNLNLFNYGAESSLAIGASLMIFLLPGRPPRYRALCDAPFWAMFVLFFVISFRGTDATNAVRAAASTALWLGLPYMLITRSLSDITRPHVRIALGAAAMMLGALVIFEAAKGWPLYAATLDQYGLRGGGAIVKIRQGILRAEGPMGEATAMGLVLVCLFALLLNSRDLFRSGGAQVACLGILTIAIGAPQSRGAWLGFAVVLLASAAFRARANAKTIVLGGASVLGLLMVIKLSSGSSDAISTKDYRSQLFSRGLEEFYKSPLIGDTYEHVVARMQDMRQGEGIVDFVNSYLYFALLTGFAGVVAFSGIFLIPSLLLWRVRGWERSAGAQFRATTFSVLLAMAGMFAFTSFGGRVAVLATIFSSLGLIGSSRLLPSRIRKSSRGGDVPAGLLAGSAGGEIIS